MIKALKFGREVRTEMKKVTWPSGKDTRMMTMMVFVMVFLFAVFLFIVDWLLTLAVNFVIGV